MSSCMQSPLVWRYLDPSIQGTELWAWDAWGERNLAIPNWQDECQVCPYFERLLVWLDSSGLCPSETMVVDLHHRDPAVRQESVRRALSLVRQLVDFQLELAGQPSLERYFSNLELFVQLDCASGCDLQEWVAKLLSDRPPALDLLEQLPCLPISTQLRAEIACHWILPQQSILCLGDDDGFARVLQVMRPDVHIEVAELDERIPATHRCDLMTGLPSELCGRFDWVALDPPYASAGAQAFMQAAHQAGGGLFLSTAYQWLEDQQCAKDYLDDHWELRKTWTGLNRYPLPDAFLQDVLNRLSQVDWDEGSIRTVFSGPYHYADFEVWTPKTKPFLEPKSSAWQ